MPVEADRWWRWLRALAFLAAALVAFGVAAAAAASSTIYDLYDTDNDTLPGAHRIGPTCHVGLESVPAACGGRRPQLVSLPGRGEIAAAGITKRPEGERRA
jgi:hypothetical protein